jgi:hypothetical protein
LTINDSTNNTWNSIVVDGKSANSEDYGGVTIAPGNIAPVSLTLTNGVNVSYGNLGLGTVDGGAFILNGHSVVTNDSTFEVYASLIPSFL